MSVLNITAKAATTLDQLKSHALVVLVPERKSLGARLRELDKFLGGSLSRTIANRDFTPTCGATTWLSGADQLDRVLLVGCGDLSQRAPASDKKIAEGLSRALMNCAAKDAIIWTEGLSQKIKQPEQLLEQIALQLTLAHYQYSQTLNHRKKPPRELRRVSVTPTNLCTTASAKRALDAGSAIGHGANLTRELVNLPGNICTPRYLAAEARKLAKRHSELSVSILDERKMADLGMHSLLSVGNGSDEPSRLITLKYQGGPAKSRPYCLVGKGITFDTGGISLKPGAKMDEMKFDMGGAASVFGSIHAAALLKLPINIVGVIAAAENMPSGRATKPGDVVKSLSGKTIEILNTDAEGRLVLCDALTYVSRFAPEEVIDIATLTGAIIVALGHEATGIFSNDDHLANSLLEAGIRSHDRGWRFPIWEEYHQQLESPFADLANIGTGGAGSITAACFLAQFTEDYKWAHLDIAGTAFKGSPKGATGRPVPMLVDYLRERSARR
jgi:leucyl aminopeptidase